METKRQAKFASLLKETMSSILMREGRGLFPSNVLVSVTKATITSDLSIARFYISVFNAEDAKDVVLTLNKSKFEFRRTLGNALNKMRKIPNLEFYLDDTLDYVEKMEKVFKNLNDEKK
ncbi:MAG: 30S ribosome-binding factor RbfA [Chitinophagales bacterium]